MLRKSLIDYTNQNYKSPSFNNILAIRLLKEKGETEAANTLIQKMEKSGRSADPVNQWVIATYKNDQTKVTDLEKGFTKNKNYLIIKKLMEVTNK